MLRARAPHLNQPETTVLESCDPNHDTGDQHVHPQVFRGRLRVPAIAAPMFLVSGPQLVGATCKAGVAAAFPTLNARSVEQLDQWLGDLTGSLDPAMPDSALT